MKRAKLFTDGACSGNPGPGGYGVVLWDEQDQVYELGDFEASTTNNRMEMQAIIVGLKNINSSTQNLWILTDSTYVIRGATQWIFGWKNRGWKNAEGGEVLNRDLWEELDRVLRPLASKIKIEWKYVPGHEGIPGNERCDQIAVEFSKGGKPYLYSGNYTDYSYDLDKLPTDMSLPAMKDYKNQKKKKAFSYLSLVNGVVQRHDSWGSCESVVKGKSGAKFKKSTSRENEIEILKSWGVDPSLLD